MNKDKVQDVTVEELVEAAKRIVRIENNIKELQLEKKEFLKNLRNSGFDTKALNKAIKEIKFKKEKPTEASIAELYMEKLQGEIL